MDLHQFGKVYDGNNRHVAWKCNYCGAEMINARNHRCGTRENIVFDEFHPIPSGNSPVPNPVSPSVSTFFDQVLQYNVGTPRTPTGPADPPVYP